ncbi:MAG: tagaturonate epimerase family protein [Armatimonadota bacterium]|nr:tagaturonate epimerase family protein [Armatimonadota bacterium]MDR7428302.1 tagaturonate epimerase family protein [Armatimonadota bacterium]MDR7463413.1 tagaturonate epimerase family protein [Armatimonadota bacterium]MDR7470216.1 tagaturonate epimerase family protein [Armatimonadota bacterium]MDR7475568.1 tagaturonate epimerase family protein [Armatimonadota bacterium]
MILPPYSLGLGDRFGRQGRAQLAAVVAARDVGVDLAPVWNKSHREHAITGTQPAAVRAEADAAVAALGWTGPYFVDADHVTLGTVDPFIPACDYFTLDVADFVGRPASAAEIEAFVARYGHFARERKIPGMDQVPGDVDVAAIAGRYLLAARQAGAIYRHIASLRGAGNFITEVSMDETASPQTPVELFFILAALAEEQVPLQAIAPRFVGRFNKGIDYRGDLASFQEHFRACLGVIAFAVQELDLPATLKLSVHSGSDKFSLYGPMARILREHRAGVHLKTAGTTWLEEVAGLALAGGEALRLVQEIYARAYQRIEELSAPYAAVLEIDRSQLPYPDVVERWSGEEYAAALRHDEGAAAYNPHFRQLLHVAFKVAAEMGPVYLQALDAHADLIGPLVTENLLERHIRPLFLQP